LVTVSYRRLPVTLKLIEIRLPIRAQASRSTTGAILKNSAFSILHFFTSGLSHEKRSVDKGKVWGHSVPEIQEGAED
jgi:hypothetical protein